MNEDEEIEQIKRDIRYWLDIIEQGFKDWVRDDYYYLCCNCGFITPFDRWTFWVWEEEWDESEGQKMIPAPEGTSDPITRCPVCRWDHVDDDSNPGIFDGTYEECAKQRVEEAKISQELWDDVAQEIFDGLS